MKKETTEKLIKTIKDNQSKFKSDKIFVEFEKSSNDFEKLVKSGLVKKRGNNLFSSIESTASKVNFNIDKSNLQIL